MTLQISLLETFLLVLKSYLNTFSESYLSLDFLWIVNELHSTLMIMHQHGIITSGLYDINA